MNHINSSKFAIYDYCISQKSDSKFTIYYEHIVDGQIVRDKLQKSNRFYISNTGTGTIIKQCSDGVDDNFEVYQQRHIFQVKNIVFQPSYHFIDVSSISVFYRAF